MNKRNRSIFFIIIILLVVLSQLIKQAIVNNIDSAKIVIDGFLKISFIKNTGGAFGLGNNHMWIFIVLNLVIIIAIIFFILRKREINKYEFSGSILVLAGGIGNLIDRIFRGYVVDYIDINDLINYPVFNLEDMLIIVGIIIIGLNIIKLEGKEKKRNSPSE